MNIKIALSICILHTICASFQILFAFLQLKHLSTQKYPPEFQDTELITEECFVEITAKELEKTKNYILYLASRFFALLVSLLILIHSGQNFGMAESKATLVMLTVILVVYSLFFVPSQWKQARNVAANISVFRLFIAYSILFICKVGKKFILLFFFVLFYEFICSFLTISTLFFFLVKIFGSLLGGWKVKDRRYSNFLKDPYLVPMEALCQTTNVPIESVYFSVESSGPTWTTNNSKIEEDYPCSAYVYGFFKVKKLVVEQGMIELLSIEELIAVCANEMYHWKKDSNFFRFLYFYIQNLLLFSFFSLVTNYKAELSELFNFHTDGIFFRILLILPLVPVYYRLTDYFFHNFTFWQTFQADKYVANVIGKRKELVKALAKIYLKNDLPLAPFELYHVFNCGHPSLLSRLIRLAQDIKVE
jgi:Zn-dependent protease with chaperone function